MKRMFFAAAALSLVLSAPQAFAQGSNQGTPNDVHGSGDMMQDGPHAAPPPASTTDLPSGMTEAQRDQACQAKWDQAVASGTTGGRSEREFKTECRRAK